MSEDIILRSLKFSGQYLSYTGHWSRLGSTDILFCSWNLNNGQSKEMSGQWRTITKMKCDMGQLLLMTRTWCPRYEIKRWITDIIVPYGTSELRDLRTLILDSMGHRTIKACSRKRRVTNFGEKVIYAFLYNTFHPI